MQSRNLMFKPLGGHSKIQWTLGMICFVTVIGWGHLEAQLIPYSMIAFYWFRPTLVPNETSPKRWTKNSWQVKLHVVGGYLLCIGMNSLLAWGGYLLIHLATAGR